MMFCSLFVFVLSDNFLSGDGWASGLVGSGAFRFSYRSARLRLRLPL